MSIANTPVRPEGAPNNSLERRGVLSLLSLLPLWLVGCAGSQSNHPKHGAMSDLSIAKDRNWKACPHKVPEEVCVKCHPKLAAKFKAKGDWCVEHDVAESQCLKCNPDLDFSPPEEPPAEADVKALASGGEDLPALEPHLVAGKVTIFDFHAVWCPPCRTVDNHLFRTLKGRSDIAIRKIDVGNWDTPVAERWLSNVAELPYLVVFSKRGKRVGSIAGAKLAELDRLIAEASR